MEMESAAQGGGRRAGRGREPSRDSPSGDARPVPSSKHPQGSFTGTQDVAGTCLTSRVPREEAKAW